MKKVSFLIALFFAITLQSQNLVNVNAKGVILDGYDVVAFQTDKEATPGHYEFQHEYNAAVYYFSSAKNLKTFKSDPAKYAPQYGGFCAVSTSMGMLEPGSVETWSVVDGKLYVQRNAKAKGMWDSKKPQMFIPNADKNWPEILKKNGSELTYKDLENGSLTLDAAKKIGDKAMMYLKNNKAPGGAIAVVDEAGYTIYLVRATGTFHAASEVSIGKARTSALFGFPSKNMEDAIIKGRTSLITVGYNMLRGGLPIKVNGKTVGGIGVSGAASADQDVEIAEAGLN